MWWFRPNPKIPSLRRENELRKLVAKQKSQITRLQDQLDAERRHHRKEQLDWETRLEEANSTILVQQIELKQQAAVIERDRARVQAETATHAAQIALASHLKTGGQRGPLIKSVSDSSGG